MQRALWGEGKYPVLIHRHAGVLEDILGILAGFKNFDEIAQPRSLPIGLIGLLIGPVRGEAMFRTSVHFGAADLHFDAHVFGEHDCRVQRFISVALWR